MGAGNVSVKIDATGGDLAIYNAFKKIVTDANVLDGDLRLNDGKLEKINFGGKARRFFNKNADSVSTEDQNRDVRQKFFDSAKKYIEGCDASQEAKDAMLALLKAELTSDSFINVPLSRRTVRMVVDAIDAMSGQKAGGADKTKPADGLTVSGRFGDFTLTKAQYTAMFKQTLIRLEKDPGVTAEKMRGFKEQVESYLAAFAKNGSLGNLGVFFMGSMDMASVIAKMTRFFDDGVLPPRAGKGKATVNVLSPDMVAEFNNLRELRMRKGDNELAKKVDITQLHPENAPDFQTLERQEGVPPQQETTRPAELPPAAKLVADLIFNDNLLEMQERQFDDGERVIQALSKNYTAFKALCQEVSELDASKKTGLIDLKENSDFFKYLDHVCQFESGNDDLVTGVLDLVRRVNKEVFGGKPLDPNVNRGAFYSHCEALYDIARDLKIEEKIDAALKNEVKEVSDTIVSTLEEAIDGGSTSDDVEALEKSNDRLLLKVLPEYFKNSGTLSLRRMFASALRQSTMPIDDQLDGGKGGEHIDFGAFLMGSGPYMLKLLQGLDIGRLLQKAGNRLTKDQQQIISGANRIKSQMPGLDVDTIYAHLLALGNTNSSMFDRVELQRELGAASVGVTYACTITVNDGGNEEKKDVVLKMLRPGIEGQLDEEAGLMLDAGRKIGLEREVGLTTESIRRELDLGQEFKALTKGREIYAKTQAFNSKYAIDEKTEIGVSQADQVDSVKPVMRGGKAVEATANCMIMERAPGVSVASFLDAINAEAKENFGLDGLGSLKEVQAAVSKKRGQLEKLHSAVLQVSAKLVEGLFPAGPNKEGYFHGDLHAGNMMYDEKSGEITLIDYGKGTWLKPSQSDAIRKLLAIAAVGRNVSDYVIAESLVDVYEQIMRTEKNDEGFKLDPDLRNRLLDEYVNMAEDGLGEGIELLASFGRTAAKVGADLPLVFFDFFGTCGKLGSEIRQVENALSDLDTAYVTNPKFIDECKAMTEDLFKAFNQASLFKRQQDSSDVSGPLSSVDQDKLPDFDHDSVVGQAINVMTGALKKVELKGVSAILEEREKNQNKAALFDLRFDKDTHYDPKDLVPPQKDGVERPFVYQAKYSWKDDEKDKPRESRLEFAFGQMQQLLKSVAMFKGKMDRIAESNGWSDLGGSTFGTLVGQLKGSAAAFRKMMANREVKGVSQEKTESFATTIQDECRFALKELSGLDEKLNDLRRQREDLNALGLYLQGGVGRLPSNAEMVRTLRSMAITGSVCGARLKGSFNGGSFGDKTVSESETNNRFVSFIQNSEDGAIVNYLDASTSNDAREEHTYWVDLVGHVTTVVSSQISAWSNFKEELNALSRNGQGGGNGALIAESRKMLESPETVIEEGLLKTIDNVVSRFDELRSTMKSDLSVGRTAYRGVVDENLERSIHLYQGPGLNEDIAKALYPDEIKFNSQNEAVVNMELDLTRDERGEYASLFDHLKTSCGERTLKSAKLPDPGVKDPNGNEPKLTRQNLSDLRRFANRLTEAISPWGNPVTAMMQNRVGKLFVGGIGKSSDTGGIKVVVNQLDKIGKAKIEGLNDFVGSFSELRLAEDNKGLDDIGGFVKELSALKTRGAGNDLVNLGIAQIKQEAESEVRCRLGKWLREQEDPPLDENHNPMDVAKVAEKIISSELKTNKDLGTLRNDMEKAGLPDTVLICALLRGREMDALWNTVNS